MNAPITSGTHHIGLSVSQLEQSAAFFTDLLGWKEVRRNDAYPAIFVSDGHIMLTLWATRQNPSQAFDKDKNVGLHHVAFELESEHKLDQLYQKLLSHAIKIEFAPEPLGQGPARHMICYEPSGIRIEFIWPANQMQTAPA
ncbi:MAG: VOC family protein [Gammaproteobacteria bacterium]|nr:VOC family protein [Gammaproteobacteria bacterium]